MPEEVFLLIFTLLSAVLFASISSAIAKWKGLNVRKWMMAGLLLGPLGLLSIFFKADKTDPIKPDYRSNIFFGLAAMLGLNLLLTEVDVQYNSGIAQMDCDKLIMEVVALSKGGENQIKVLGIYETKIKSRSDNRLECEGVAVLSNAEKLAINYRYYHEYDQWWVSYNFE